jgi:hypothetical protein
MILSYPNIALWEHSKFFMFNYFTSVSGYLRFARKQVSSYPF